MKNQCKRFIAAIGAVAMVISFTACAKTHTHDYSQMGSNKTHHWKYCPEDNEKDSSTLEKHVDANSDGKCDVCGYDVGKPHVHDYSAWGSDAENHWKYCPEDNEKDASSVAAHVDADDDGKCDVCGQDTKAPEEASVTIDTTGVPTLIVKGPITQACGCVKLHGEANGTNLYWDNVSKFSNSYEFRVPLSDLPLEGTPWVWFHIYAYESASPANKDNFTEKFDLDRGNVITVGQSVDYEGVRYTVIGNGDSTQLVIQPKEIPGMAVESIQVEVIGGKPMVVVKGTMPTDVPCIKLHADGNGKHYYGDNVSTQAGTFELQFDLSQVPVDDTPWLWFHIYTYEVASPADLQANFKKLDLEHGTWVKVGDKLECDGIVYTVQDQNQLVIQPKAEPKLSVDSISVDTTGKPTLIVKGTMPSNVGCIKIHADAKGDNYYGNNVSTKANEFELHFDLTQIRKDGEWAWFHIWTYTDKNPADLTAASGKMDLLRGELLTGTFSCDYENAHYELVSEGEYYGLVVFYATQEQTDEPEKPEENENVSVSLDISTGVPTLVVKGTMPENVGCIKLHGDANGADLFWDNVSKESNTYEFRAPVSDLPLENTPWVWFHVYIYGETEPANTAVPALKIDLPRGDVLKVDQYIDYKGVRYTVKGSGNSTQLVIQPKEAPRMKVESITVETVEGKPVLVVKGTMPDDVACIKLQADAKGANYYGDNVSTQANKFELRFDLTQIRKDGEWAWFHIWTYADEEPTDLANYKEQIDLLRGELLTGTFSCDYENVHYELVSEGEYYGLVVFKANQNSTETPDTPEVPDKLEVTEVTVDVIDGVPTLIVKGTMTEKIVCVKLHGSAHDADLYWENFSEEAGVFELRMPLNTLPLENTPWVFFHVFGYKEAEPADPAHPPVQINLERGNVLEAGMYIDFGEVRYKVIADGDSTQLIIQPTKAPTMTVESIKLEIKEGKPVLVVKGTMPDSIACIKLHADGNEGAQYFGDNVSTESGKFELHMDLSQVPADDTPWLWFHIYTYDEKEPADLKANYNKINLNRDNMIQVDEKVECDGIVYTVLDKEQLVVQPKEAPKLSVTEVTVDTTERPTLVLKGTLPSDVACIKLHVSANKAEFYVDNISEEAGKFELHFDLTQVGLEGTPWIWFHLYTYAEAEPADPASGKEHDLQRGNWLADDAYWDYEDVRYSIVSGDGTWGLLVIQPGAVPEEKPSEDQNTFGITEITIKEGKPILVVTGKVPAGVTDIKLYTDPSKDGQKLTLFSDPAVITDGTFEMSFDLTQLPANGEWAYFQIYVGGAYFADLPREGFLPESGSVDYEGVRYKIEKQSWDQLIISALPN